MPRSRRGRRSRALSRHAAQARARECSRRGQAACPGLEPQGSSTDDAQLQGEARAPRECEDDGARALLLPPRVVWVVEGGDGGGVVLADAARGRAEVVHAAVQLLERYLSIVPDARGQIGVWLVVVVVGGGVEWAAGSVSRLLYYCLLWRGAREEIVRFDLRAVDGDHLVVASRRIVKVVEDELCRTGASGNVLIAGEKAGHLCQFWDSSRQIGLRGTRPCPAARRCLP